MSRAGGATGSARPSAAYLSTAGPRSLPRRTEPGRRPETSRPSPAWPLARVLVYESPATINAYLDNYGTAGGFDAAGWTSGGGTSLASPLWAALAVLADQRTPGHRLGLLSPALYGIDRSDSAAFTDVTVGNDNYLAPSGSPANDTCTYQGVVDQPCYEATPGYDMATGLGSPRAGLLVADLAAG